jgi:radical SAM-linked protein
MRLRVRYAKLGKIRFISHRDTARVWERALRRAGVPVASSEGFNPRQRVSFGLALPTGAESIAEYLDLELVEGAEPGDLDPLAERLTEVLPGGLTALLATTLEPGAGSLQDVVTSVTWELSPPMGAEASCVSTAADRLLSAAALPLERERKGERRIDDVRPLIVSLTTSADGVTMIAELSTVGRSLRPAELASLAFPGTEPGSLRVMRTHQWIEHDGDRREVLSLPAAVPAPTAEVSA